MTSKRDSSAVSADLKEKLDEIIEFYKKDKSLEIPQTSETMEKLVQLRQVKYVMSPRTRPRAVRIALDALNESLSKVMNF